uniref:Uncharacterized protein n=1 Tax=Rhizophora mucronata TaxID=61149 RepID=A0A2P2NET4_RHIMU
MLSRMPRMSNIFITHLIALETRFIIYFANLTLFIQCCLI